MKTKRKNAKQTNEKDKKKQRQISVKLSEDLYARLRAAADIQEHTAGQLGRILIEWALPFYEKSRSVEALKYLATRYFTRIVQDTPLEQSQVISLEQMSLEAEMVEEEK